MSALPRRPPAAASRRFRTAPARTTATHSACAPALASCLAVVASTVVACGPPHIAPHTPRSRRYDASDYAAAPRPVSTGSLWPDSGRGLFADFRAYRVGDIVTIRIDETADAHGDSGTRMERESSMSFGMPALLGITGALARAYPGIDPGRLIDLVSETSFRGDGSTTRESRVRGAIAVRVKQGLPNGDLFVEGTKVVLVNDEELHIYLSGVIRPEDIEPDNSVRSTLVADAQIEFTGRGVLSDNQRQGWLVRLLQSINPF
jgi:flagellar L-ring protein precursor FlgH